ncbi:MAG: aminotransferase class V-fold PLP-dependent enzyme [Micromonosporaceae bacterium]
MTTAAPTEVRSYLDHAGIGLVRPTVRAAMTRVIDEVLARGSTEYGQFFAARGQVRAAAAARLECDPDEVALVANTSTGLHLVADGLDWRPGDEVVVFERDFPANVQPWRRLTEAGVRLRWVPQRAGGYDLDDVRAAIGPATRLVAVSHVNFLTGFRIDLDALCALAAEHAALVCVDAVQSAGVVPLSLARTPIDFLVAGGHKWLGGPPGTGMFFCRAARLELLRRAPLGWFGYDRSDLLFGQGPGHLLYDLPPRPAARRFEGGMLNFVGIVGFGAALAEIDAVGMDAIWARVQRLTAMLRAGVTERGYVLAGPDDPDRSSGIVTFRSPAGDRLDDVHARLLAGGCRCSYPDGHIRFSPHYWTADDEIEVALDLLPPRT